MSILAVCTKLKVQDARMTYIVMYNWWTAGIRQDGATPSGDPGAFGPPAAMSFCQTITYLCPCSYAWTWTWVETGSSSLTPS